MKRPGDGLVKFFRFLVWGIVIIFLPVGLHLLKTSQLTKSISDNSATAKYASGKIIIVITLIFGTLNLIWGIIRYTRQIKLKQYPAGKIIGSIIGNGIWKTLVILPVVFSSFVFLAPRIGDIVSENSVKVDTRYLNSSYARLKSDFESGLISADDYVSGLINVPEGYRSDIEEMTPDILSALEENAASLSESVLNDAISVITLSNIEFSTDAASNKTSTFNLFSQNVSARTTDVTTLNKAKLSSGGHFVVFYTNTGDDSIPDSEAVRIGELAESIIQNYQKNLGLSFQYDPIDYGGKKRYDSLKKALAANEIDENAIETAMPIYVANPYKEETNTLASYAGRDWKNRMINIVAMTVMSITGDDTAALYKSAPTLPFVNILPSNSSSESLAIVLAHELGHHYADYYCHDYFGTGCSYDGQFVKETAPNYMAIHTTPTQPRENVVNNHHDIYVEFGTCYPIDTVLPKPTNESCHSEGSFEGYPSFAFLENYASIVSGGHEKVLDALFYDNTLKYLSLAATPEEFSKVLVTLSQKNLTNDYDTVSLRSNVTPHGEDIPCKSLCTKSYSVNHASMRYFYFSKSEYENRQITITESDSLYYSILGNNNGKYELISSGNGSSEYVYQEDSLYDIITIAIVNPSVTDTDMVSLSITEVELLDVIEDDDPAEPTLLTDAEDFNLDISFDGTCARINIHSMLDIPRYFFTGLSDAVVDFWPNISEELATLSHEVDETETLLSENGLTNLSICDTKLSNGASYSEAKNLAKRTMSHSLTIYEENKISAYLAYDLITSQYETLIVVESDGELHLYSVVID